MLLRFDPFRELDRWTEEMTQVARTPAIPMDAVRKGDQVHLTFDLPGFDPSSIDLQVERNVLSVKAERHWERAEDEQVLAAERRHGTFTRQLFLSDNLDGSRVQASYHDGLLEVTIPIAETAKPRKIEVTAGPARGQTAIDATSSEASQS
ncbi:MAG: Hsp20/alpha crystallin family protein [Acidimicrobiales bacterium]|nr:Hsp20/alpha crystallin family protein [Acidimicrobiales bacterium]